MLFTRALLRRCVCAATFWIPLGPPLFITSICRLYFAGARWRSRAISVGRATVEDKFVMSPMFEAKDKVESAWEGAVFISSLSTWLGTDDCAKRDFSFVFWRRVILVPRPHFCYGPNTKLSELLREEFWDASLVEARAIPGGTIDPEEIT